MTGIHEAFDAVLREIERLEATDAVNTDLALMNAYRALQVAKGHMKDARARVQVTGAMRQIAALKGIKLEDAA